MRKNVYPTQLFFPYLGTHLSSVTHFELKLFLFLTFLLIILEYGPIFIEALKYCEITHRVFDGHGLPHDVDLALVRALVLGPQVLDLQRVVLPQPDPPVLPDHSLGRSQHPAALSPHQNKLTKVGHL